MAVDGMAAIMSLKPKETYETSLFETIKARNAKSDWATPKLVKFAGSEGENEGNVGFCEDTSNKENTNNQDFDSEN